jgi:hypothetical protein
MRNSGALAEPPILFPLIRPTFGFYARQLLQSRLLKLWALSHSQAVEVIDEFSACGDGVFVCLARLCRQAVITSPTQVEFLLFLLLEAVYSERAPANRNDTYEVL